MRTDFISQRDPGDENDYWYVKFGYSLWSWMMTNGIILVKGDAVKKMDWIEKSFDYKIEVPHAELKGFS